MALSSALFSGISGLSTLGSAMQIIGDNIANVNTVGFKSSTYCFQDLLSQATSTMSGTSQVGRGTALGDIGTYFEQGSFESTGNSTDLAIGGDGFFAVREPGSNENFYSRAGNFQFDEIGNFTNPEGYVVQGWVLDANGEDTGSITDIKLSSFTSPPDDTDQVDVIVNLDSDGTDNSTGADTTLSTVWDATNSPPVAANAYEYQTTMKVYDSLGSTHDITVFFDKGDTASTYEFIVTCNPSEDARAAFAGDADQGLLGRGVLTFNAGSGVITGITLDQHVDPGDTAADWTADTPNAAGYMEFVPQFIAGIDQPVGVNFGSMHNGSQWVNDSLSTTYYARASTTTYQSADGYGAGDLQGVDVDVDGVMSGTYSNGEIIPLFRVALARFQNLQGLYKEGSNLYSETRDSGEAITNRPGTNGLGSIAPNSLEQSNVDIANEFVKMITTQRGYQANSKIITVTDQMLNELINLKR